MTKLTQKEIKALRIVRDCKCLNGIRPKEFGAIYFDTPEHGYLLTSMSNIGNGATHGVKAWRAAGCILGKLKKKGLLGNAWGFYRLTPAGQQALHDNNPERERYTEHRIGTFITLPDGRKAKVMEGLGCEKCIFGADTGCDRERYNVFGLCSSEMRADRKQVIYMEVQP